MSITRMKVTGRRGMGNITLSIGKDGQQTVRATGKMADLIARGMASDLGIDYNPKDTPEPEAHEEGKNG